MTFASEIVDDAAAFILVNEDDIGLEPNESARGLRILNDWLAALFTEGIDIGYRPVVSVGDPVTIPLAANLAVKQNLGIQLAPMFGMPIDPDQQILADKSLDGLRGAYQRRIKSTRPTTLPMGAGNLSNIYTQRAFYAFPLPRSILRLDSSSTITIATINTPVLVGGWTVDQSINVDALAAGTVEYLNNDPHLAMLEASFTVNAASSDQFTFYFRKNSALLEQTAMVFDADAAQNVLLKAVETLRRGDKVDIAIENNDGTTNIVLANGHFLLS